MKIDWTSSENYILTNPRMEPAEAEKIVTTLKAIPIHGHIWISTSGTTSTAKWAALSKKAILDSADAVNRHLKANANDIWLNPLPQFHVGGLGIFARCHQNGSYCIPFEAKWDPLLFNHELVRNKVTLTSLVPTQVHDLVQLNLRPPESLRAIIVGGGRLSDHLYEEAEKLGWPLLPSYGMTECCSQIATAELHHPTKLRILSHVEVKITPEGLISVRSPSLLTGYAHIGSRIVWEDPKKERWLVTSDRGNVNGHYLEVLGRADEMIKIGGENVDFSYLESILDRCKGNVEAVLLPIDDPRLGIAVHLCIAGNNPGKEIIEKFNAAVMPFERIRKVHHVDALPKTDLGKVRRSELIKQIQ